MADKPKRKRDQARVDPDTFPCPVCGGTDFTWGKTYGYAGASFVFKSESSRWYQSGKRTDARECNRCGNVLLFTK
jgi:hypothetical protein